MEKNIFKILFSINFSTSKFHLCTSNKPHIHNSIISLTNHDIQFCALSLNLKFSFYFFSVIRHGDVTLVPKNILIWIRLLTLQRSPWNSVPLSVMWYGSCRSLRLLYSDSNRRGWRGTFLNGFKVWPCWVKCSSWYVAEKEEAKLNAHFFVAFLSQSFVIRCPVNLTVTESKQSLQHYFEALTKHYKPIHISLTCYLHSRCWIYVCLFMYIL